MAVLLLSVKLDGDTRFCSEMNVSCRHDRPNMALVVLTKLTPIHECVTFLRFRPLHKGRMAHAHVHHLLKLKKIIIGNCTVVLR
jgi:hypothetical protein